MKERQFQKGISQSQKHILAGMMHDVSHVNPPRLNKPQLGMTELIMMFQFDMPMMITQEYEIKALRICP